MIHYFNEDEELTEEELKKVIELIANCTNLDEVWFETDEEDRPLLKRLFKSKFLPTSAQEEEPGDEYD